MKYGAKIASIALLCLFGMESASAGQFRGSGGREGFRAGRQQRPFQQEPRQPMPPDGRRAAPEAARAPVSAPAPQRGFEAEPGGNFGNRPWPQGRQPGDRMTAQQRRDMRHQINDAAHELYEPQK